MKQSEDSIDGNPSSTKIHIPPIIVYGIINYGEIMKRIRYIDEEKNIAQISGKQYY